MKLRTIFTSIILTLNFFPLSLVSPFVFVKDVKQVYAQEEMSTSEFLYTASGQRIAKLSGEGDHTYYLPGVEVTVKPDGSTSYRRYYSFNNNLTAVREDTEVAYLHGDNLGSLALATDASGNPTGEQAYYPYGTSKGTTGEMAGERKYTGQVSDENLTSLYYYNARYYSPALGRFTQADMIDDGLNRYTYVANNPINLNDPTGQCVDPPCMGEPGPDMTESIPEWYLMALDGDYSEVPPMEFHTPDEMFEWGYRYGLEALWERADRATREVEYWRTQIIPDVHSYQLKMYIDLLEALMQDYPDLTIRYDMTDSGLADYEIGARIITLAYPRTGQSAAVVRLTHEFQHYLDDVKYGGNYTLDWEVRALFRDSQLPYASDGDREGSGYFLHRIWELRSWGVSDEAILDFMVNNVDMFYYFSHPVNRSKTIYIRI